MSQVITRPEERGVTLTASKERISFAHVLVEIDPTKELRRSIEIQLPSGKIRQQKVWYENEPKFCSMCKVLGHSASVCKRTGLKGQVRGGAGARSTGAPPKGKDLVPNSTGGPEGVPMKGTSSPTDVIADIPVPNAVVSAAGGQGSINGNENGEGAGCSHAATSVPNGADPDGSFQPVKVRKQRNGNMDARLVTP